MSKRKYTHMVQMEPIILQMKEAGMVHSEIAAELGLTTEQVKSCVWRYLKRQKVISYGNPPKPKGRPRKDGQPPRQDLQKEVERLRMENKLLRDFLQSTERK